ncbi:MAG: LysR family transcriptional regulator [Aeriscardovia sp.]|nr:LysR family transcriptional regulator [Aeriscardovia sp.]
MLFSSLFNISLQQVYIFLKAAKYENFSQVAAEFNMTQPTVSRNIESLENELQLILFIREKQRVRLTPAGKEIYEEWQRQVALMENVVHKALQIQKGNLNQLYIGDFNTTSISEYLLPIIELFEKENKNVELHIDRTDPLTVVEGVLEHKYDVGFFSSAGKQLVKEKDLDYFDLFTLDPVIFIPEKHPLYLKKTIDKKDLEEAKYAVLEDISMTYWRQAVAACSECGFTPHDYIETPNAQSMVISMERGECLVIMDDCYQPALSVKTRQYRLEESKTKFGFILIYEKKNTDPNVSHFIKAAKQYVKNR